MTSKTVVYTIRQQLFQRYIARSIVKSKFKLYCLLPQKFEVSIRECYFFKDFSYVKTN